MANQSDKKEQVNFSDLIPGIISSIPRLPQIAKSGISTLTLFNDAPLSIGRIIEINARKYRNKKALVCDDVSYTYNEFNQITNQYARFFKSFGVKKKEVVIIFLENRVETIILTAALAKIGAIASLINPNQRDKVLEHSINIKHGSCFVIGEELLDAFEAVRPNLDISGVHLLGMKDKGGIPFPHDYINLSTVVKSYSKRNMLSTQLITTKDHFAYIFTSGTTGMPKAAVQTHKKWLRAYNWFGKINMGLNSKDVLYVSIPFYHASALIIGWATAFSNGSTIAMRRKFSTSEFWKDVKKYDATAFIYIGEICRYLMNAPVCKEEKNNKISKVVGNGLRPEIWKEFKERFEVSKIYELYAASDSNVIFTNTFNIDGCVGWSPTGYEIVKYDVENDEPLRDEHGFMQKVKQGESGLMISKITKLFPFAGYANSKKNDAKIFKDVFKPGDQWYNTGDLMRDIGFKHAQFVDRVGDTFRWKGENVSTAEVEDVLNSLEDVDLSAVYGVQIPKCDGRAGMATIVLKKDIDFEYLSNQLNKVLPNYAVPIFMRIGKNLEVTHTQKIKKGTLKKEGFDIREMNDAVFVLLPKSNKYVPLTEMLFDEIKEGKYNF